VEKGRREKGASSLDEWYIASRRAQKLIGASQGNRHDLSFCPALLVCGFSGETWIAAGPVLVAQQEHRHDEHDLDAHAAESAMDADFEEPIRRESYLVWFYKALGIRYTVLLPGSGLMVFLGALAVIGLARRPAPLAAYMLFVPLPFFIGVFAAVDGMIAAYSVIAYSSTMPKPSEFAAGYSTALVAPLVGMLVTAPTYLIVSAALLFKCFALPAGESQSGKF
jgi:hypothetical protein